MVNFCRKHEGTIAVFLTLILIPTFIFSGVMVDGSRIMASKNLVSGAGDLAMNAALSNYHEQLNGVYGLLAMADTAQEIESIMQDCFETSLNASGVSRDDFAKALVYLELTEGGFSASNLVDTEIYQTEVFKQEVLEYMKYRGPVMLLDRAMETKVGSLETIAEERAAADAELKFEKELNDVQELLDELKDLIYGKGGQKGQNWYVNAIGSEQSLNRLLADTKEDYDEITLLAVTHYRLSNCTDSDSGDMRSLMERMADLACDISSITPEVASNLIKMKRIENAMRGQNPSDLLEGLEIGSDEYNEIQRIISEYDNAKSILADGTESVERQLDALVEESYTNMHAQWECAKEGSENCTDIVEKLNEIKEKLADSEEKYEVWKSAVNDLSNSESKQAYQESIDDVSGLFENEGIIAEFEEKINNNKVYFDEVTASLDAVTFVDKRVDYEIDSKTKFMDAANYGQIIESGEVSNAASSFMARYHAPDAVALSVTIDKTVDEQDEFVNKLKNEYCNTDSADQAKADEATTTWKNKLNEKKNKLTDLLTTGDIPADNVRTIAGNDLPSVWLGIAPEGDYGGGSIEAEGSLDDKEARKKAAESGSKNLNEDNATLTQMSTLGSQMAGVGEDIIEPLYFTEYVMDMFSYYTVNRDRNGNEISPQSLSRASLEGNAIYRAEVEYILWGSPNVRSNINKTKAIIFAANFVFNMCFAFTDSKLTSQARTIASFFPVGAMGRIAIKCALQTIAATIETVDNMVDLMDGKAVPLIKRQNKWNTWLLGRPVPYDEGSSGFTYEDYLWILVCVNMYTSNQKNLLGRTADCIELNLTEKKTNNSNTLKHMYTMVSVDAVVSIDTFFLQRLGGAGYDVSYDRNTFKVDYHGIQGY